MNPKISKIKEIKQRLTEYLVHRNDPYAYDEREIPEVRVFYDHAPDDIQTLLNEIEAVYPDLKWN